MAATAFMRATQGEKLPGLRALGTEEEARDPLNFKDANYANTHWSSIMSTRSGDRACSLGT